MSGEWDVLEQEVVMAANPSYHPGFTPFRQILSEYSLRIHCVVWPWLVLIRVDGFTPNDYCVLTYLGLHTADIGLRTAVYNAEVAHRYDNICNEQSTCSQWPVSSQSIGLQPTCSHHSGIPEWIRHPCAQVPRIRHPCPFIKGVDSLSSL